MKEKLKEMLPCWMVNIVKYIKNTFLLFPVYAYWFWKDISYNNGFKNEKSDLAHLLVAGHVLEKGITMPERRMGFGYERVRSLIQSCLKAIGDYSNNHIEIQCTLKDLEQYLQIHQKANYQLPNDITTGIENLLQYKTIDTQPCYETTKEEYFKKTNDFFDFAHQRHSVRWYSEESIDKETLMKAIELAQTAPSACNRQSSRVYIVETEEKKEKILQLQNGNRGFGYLADIILLITSDMKCWNYQHRTSAYLDAGLFTMNLLYALHYYHICACTLNAHLSVIKRSKLREVVGYSKSEIPIVFISIGNPSSHFSITGSQRINTNQIFSFI